MDGLTNFFARSGFLPHGYCFTWTPELLWSMVGADAVIAASYFSIPLVLVTFARQRPTWNQNGVAWLFSAFIFACGVTHVMDIWTIWRPDYGAQAVTKIVTAVISLVTAVALWPLIPRALRIPSVDQLQRAVASLEAEVERRKTAEEHLLELEQTLAVTRARVGAGFIATDTEGQVTRMNAVAEQVTGWSQAEARGTSLWQVFDREDRPPELAQKNPLVVMQELGITVDEERSVVAISRRGARTALEVRATLMRREGGQPAGLAMVFRDVTRLNRAEREARRLAAIVSSSSDAIIGKTLDGRITDWNDAAQAMFGYSADEAIGRSVQMLIPPELEAEEAQIIGRVSKGESVPNFDTVRQTKEGRRLDVSLAVSPIRDALGHIVGAAKIARDITENKRRDAELRRSNAELEQFAYVASHDLQEPLRMIVNYTELLQTRYQGQFDAKADKYLHYVADGGRRMQRLVVDLLEYARVGTQGKPLVAVQAGSVLDGVLSSVQQLIREAGATVERAALPTVMADEPQLHQLLQNLLTNAIKFRSDAAPHIRCGVERAGRFWRFSIADNGIGFEAQYAERAFQMFQRLHERGTYEGSGIGLAIAKRIVERHGGEIWVQSAPGAGSTFYFTLLAEAGLPATSGAASGAAAATS